MDPIDWEITADKVDDVFEDAPRLSPAARRFMAGDMDDYEARLLGFLPPDAV